MTTEEETRQPLSLPGQAALESFTAYLEQQQDMSPKTVRNYGSDLAQFLAWSESREEGAAFSPVRVAVPTLTRYRAHLQSTRHLSVATINRHLITLKRYFGWLHQEGVIPANPAQVVKTLAMVTQPVRHLEDYEEERLVAAATRYGNLRDKTILILLLQTGLRAAEVCALHYRDITLGERKGVVRVRAGKGRKYREVPLNSTVRAVLREYLSSSSSSSSWQEEDVLFPSEKTQGSLTERAIGYIVNRIARLARVEDVSPHDLRHRFGYRMAETVPLHLLAQMMGHSSLDTTRIYTRPTAQDLQVAVEQIAWQ